MTKICCIETTKGEKPADGAVSINEANSWIESHLNPDLSKCGTMPGCRECTLIPSNVKFGREIRQVGERVSGEMQASNRVWRLFP